uniref:Uncharacterized protein n=1 Tax=Oryza meridionalis TaxID=40149 RepID=A0A0E0CH60_9ORYZ
GLRAAHGISRPIKHSTSHHRKSVTNWISSSSSSSSSSPARSPTEAATPDRRRSPEAPARAGEYRDKGGVVEYRVKEREISPRLVVSSTPRAAAKTNRGGGAAIEQSRGGEGRGSWEE